MEYVATQLYALIPDKLDKKEKKKERKEINEGLEQWVVNQGWAWLPDLLWLTSPASRICSVR